MLIILLITALFFIFMIFTGCESKSHRKQMNQFRDGRGYEKCVVLSSKNGSTTRNDRPHKIFRLKRLKDSTVFNRTYQPGTYFEDGDTIMVYFAREY